MRWPAALPAQAAPLTARLMASVPPLVKMMLRASAPMLRASRSWASSSQRRACRPGAWGDEGLPPSPSRMGSISASTSGRRGVEAAWSRYTVTQRIVGVDPRQAAARA